MYPHAQPPSATTLQPPPDAAERQQRLDRMKLTATGLLAVMAAVFAACLVLEPRYPWLAYVRATSEAAMVGWIADWFAITALFLHPLGVKIPYTAIIPARKDRIGRTLVNFVEHNFLSDAVLVNRLRSVGM